MAYILYNLVKADIHNPALFAKFEKRYRIISDHVMVGRYAYGGLWAYVKSNQGSMFGLDFWTEQVQKHSDDMRVFEVIELMEAFRGNRQLHRSWMRELLDTTFKN